VVVRCVIGRLTKKDPFGVPGPLTFDHQELIVPGAQHQIKKLRFVGQRIPPRVFGQGDVKASAASLDDMLQP